MYDVLVYHIAQLLWRWEIRAGGALLRCGTAPTEVAAQNDVKKLIRRQVG